VLHDFKQSMFDPFLISEEPTRYYDKGSMPFKKYPTLLSDFK